MKPGDWVTVPTTDGLRCIGRLEGICPRKREKYERRSKELKKAFVDCPDDDIMMLVDLGKYQFPQFQVFREYQVLSSPVTNYFGILDEQALAWESTNTGLVCCSRLGRTKNDQQSA